MKPVYSLLSLILLNAALFGQTKDAYLPAPNETGGGLLDTSRLQIGHSVSMGMSSASGSSLRSQGLYTTMMQYEFAKPVTLNLNFGMPLFSTSDQARNLTPDNLQSAEYYKSMPFDISLSWKPKDNLLMRFSVMRRSAEDYYNGFGRDERLYSPIDGRRIWP